VVSSEELATELVRMTDWYTDELFMNPQSVAVVFPFSRLVVDVERFFDDRKEPMARKGMGWSYLRTSQGTPLTKALDPETQRYLATVYWDHHKRLTELVSSGTVVLDCHSFPSKPLPCDLDQTSARPDICIGTDPVHTPQGLREITVDFFQKKGLVVDVDKPYSGTLVPFSVYRKDPTVKSIMVEVNRSLYVEEATGKKSENFSKIRKIVGEFVEILQALGPNSL